MTHNHTDHLQTPLRVIKGEVNSFRPSRTCYRIVDASGEFVARLHDKEPADTLCRFVNSHGGLVEALKHVCYEIDRDMGLFDNEKIAAALAAAAQEPTDGA